MKYFSFNEQIAVSYGVDEAVFIDALEFWIVKNRANERHFHDGRWWSYNSLEAFGRIFPFWSKRQLERIIASCKKQGLIHTGNYSDSKMDRTTWYALDDRVLEIYGDYDCIAQDGDIDVAAQGRADHEAVKCTNNSSLTTVNNPPIVPPQGDELFDGFWKAYPRKVNKPSAERAWKKLKANPELLASMLSALERQKRGAAWTKDGGQFIPHPATWLNGRRWEDKDVVPGGSIPGSRTASELEVFPEWT